MPNSYKNIAICSNCIGDEFLKRIVETNCTAHLCHECGAVSANAIELEALGKLMEPIIRDNFALGESVRQFSEDDHDWWEQEGEPLQCIVQEVLGQYFSCENEIVSAICHAEEVWPPNGEEPFFDTTASYVQSDIRLSDYYTKWHELLDEIKHKRRFFSPSAQSLFTLLFDGVENVRSINKERSAFESVITEISVGHVFYRARICDRDKNLVDFYTDPLKHVGPPPNHLASAGRMNAEGVSVFYGAFDVETSIAEVRPVIGDSSVVIELETTLPLRLLDFTRLETATSSKSLSYFQADFKMQVEKHAFLRRLHSLISQPILQTKSADYLITQTMAEYLAHVHNVKFDGVIFASVQKQNGKNVVIFPNTSSYEVANFGFPLKYVDDSIKLFSTHSVKYTNKKHHVSVTDGTPYIHFDVDE
jgi:hypothetical protein